MGSHIEPTETWENGEARFLGWRLSKGTPPAKEGCERLRDELARFLVPCDPDTAVKELARLSVSCIPRTSERPETAALRAAVFVEEVRNYPADVVIWACREYANFNAFFPAWAELRKLLEERARRRRLMDQFCQEWIARANRLGGMRR